MKMKASAVLEVLLEHRMVIRDRTKIPGAHAIKCTCGEITQIGYRERCFEAHARHVAIEISKARTA
jgi:hypothetical protein